MKDKFKNIGGTNMKNEKSINLKVVNPQAYFSPWALIPSTEEKKVKKIVTERFEIG